MADVKISQLASGSPLATDLIAYVSDPLGLPITKQATISSLHMDTSTQSSISNVSPNVIQSISLDDYGHITSASSLATTPSSGWIPFNGTWTVASGTTFTTSGDYTSLFRPGTRLRFTQSSTAKFYTVVSSSYGSPNTTVTVIANDDTTFSGTITNPSYSYMYYPAWFPRRCQMFIPASAMKPYTDSAPSAGTLTFATPTIRIPTLDFDASAVEYAAFTVRMPEWWDGGTVRFKFSWSHPSTTTNFGVVWAANGACIADGDALNASVGSAVSVTDTGGTADYSYISDWTGAMTFAGTPAGGNYAEIRFYRSVTNGSDTLAVDARLHGVTMEYTRL